MLRQGILVGEIGAGSGAVKALRLCLGCFGRHISPSSGSKDDETDPGTLMRGVRNVTTETLCCAPRLATSCWKAIRVRPRVLCWQLPAQLHRSRLSKQTKEACRSNSTSWSIVVSGVAAAACRSQMPVRSNLWRIMWSHSTDQGLSVRSTLSYMRYMLRDLPRIMRGKPHGVERSLYMCRNLPGLCDWQRIRGQLCSLASLVTWRTKRTGLRLRQKSRGGLSASELWRCFEPSLVLCSMGPRTVHSQGPLLQHCWLLHKAASVMVEYSSPHVSKHTALIVGLIHDCSKHM